jgi:hypothetical protein
MVSHNLLYLCCEEVRRSALHGEDKGKYEQFQRIDSMHYPQYQCCVAVLLFFSLLLQSCRSSLHAVMEESNPPMRHEIGNHGEDSITSTPSTAIVPDSIPSVPSGVPASGSSVLRATEEEVPASGLKRKRRHSAHPPRSSSASGMRQLASIPSVPSTAIGPKEWEQYFGEVGAVSPLPENIDEILNSPCPFWEDKQVKDTHLLVLVSATVDGRPFTLNLLGGLIKNPQGGGSKTEYGYYDSAVQKKLGTRSPGSSYWVLMTRDVLPDSRSKTYNAQKALVAAHASRLDLPYEIPDALSAATAILVHHARAGERLYTDDPYTYTRCQEKVGKNDYPVFVGGFSSEGLVVFHSYIYDFCGVSCIRKF